MLPKRMRTRPTGIRSAPPSQPAGSLPACLPICSVPSPLAPSSLHPSSPSPLPPHITSPTYIHSSPTGSHPTVQTRRNSALVPLCCCPSHAAAAGVYSYRLLANYPRQSSPVQSAQLSFLSFFSFFLYPLHYPSSAPLQPTTGRWAWEKRRCSGEAQPSVARRPSPDRCQTGLLLFFCFVLLSWIG